jgi:hypothetical protein
MSALAWIIVIVALIAIAAIAWAAWSRRRTTTLQERFGPEYDRTAGQAGSRREAESELSSRIERRDELDIRPLAPPAAERYSNRWRDLQSRFVDAPKQAVADSDRLVQDVMRERGYPIEHFEQRAADLSVDHGDVVEHYRAGHAIALACEMDRASTEDLRKAVMHYRALFERLMVTDDRSAGATMAGEASSPDARSADEVTEGPTPRRTA